MIPNGVKIAMATLIALVVAFFLGHWIGYGAGALDVRRQVTEDSLKHVTKTLELTTPVLRAQHQAAQIEDRKDSTARAVHAVARGRIRVVNDSQVVAAVVHDSAGVTVAIADSLGVRFDTLTSRSLVSAVVTADAALAQDSTAKGTQAAENQTLYRRDSLHTTIEHLQDQELKDEKPQRCGRRCGFIAGVTTVVAVGYGVTHPAQVVKAAKWIIRLVH